MSIDYADDDINNLNESSLAENAPRGAILTNNSTIMYEDGKAKVIVGKSSDVVHYVHPVIGMYAKPSCGCKYSYKYWYYKEFVNYCPNCHHYNVLLKNPKGTYEKEWTCRRCSSDFCGVCGKEKYSWSKVYLRSA